MVAITVFDPLKAIAAKNFGACEWGSVIQVTRDRVTGHVLGDFSKADHVWLDPLLEAIADHAGLLASSEDNSFNEQNCSGSSTVTVPEIVSKNSQQRPTLWRNQKSQSHIRQARTGKKPKVPSDWPDG